MVKMRVRFGDIDAIEGILDEIADEVREACEEWTNDVADTFARHARNEAPRGAMAQGEKVSERKRPPLRDSIHRGPLVRAGQSMSITVGIDDSQTVPWGGGTSIASFVEHGTKAHDIEPKSPDGVLAFHGRIGSRLARRKGQVVAGPTGGLPRSVFRVQRGAKKGQVTSRKSGATLSFAKKVRHPGTKPNPFFRRAWETTKPYADARGNSVRARVARAWRQRRGA